MLITACIFAYVGIGGLVAVWTAHLNLNRPMSLQRSPSLNGAMWLPFFIAGSIAYLGSLIIAGAYAAYEASGADKHRR